MTSSPTHPLTLPSSSMQSRSCPSSGARATGKGCSIATVDVCWVGTKDRNTAPYFGEGRGGEGRARLRYAYEKRLGGRGILGRDCSCLYVGTGGADSFLPSFVPSLLHGELHMSVDIHHHHHHHHHQVLVGTNRNQQSRSTCTCEKYEYCNV